MLLMGTFVVITDIISQVVIYYFIYISLYKYKIPALFTGK